MQTAQTNSGHVAGGKTEADTGAHTPTPWHSTSSGMGVHHYVEARIRPGVIQEIASCGPTEGAEGSRGNAEFIVRAVNAHDDLLEALGKIAAFAPGNGDVCEIIAKIARNALAKAGANN